MLITYALDPSHLFFYFLKCTCFIPEFEKKILSNIYKLVWEAVTLFPAIQSQ